MNKPYSMNIINVTNVPHKSQKPIIKTEKVILGILVILYAIGRVDNVRWLYSLQAVITN